MPPLKHSNSVPETYDPNRPPLFEHIGHSDWFGDDVDHFYASNLAKMTFHSRDLAPGDKIHLFGIFYDDLQRKKFQKKQDAHCALICLSSRETPLVR